MRIWIITSELPTYVGGGIARYVDNFARALAEAGHEALVLCRSETPEDREIVSGYRSVTFVPKQAHTGAPQETPHPDEHPSYPYNVIGYWPGYSWELAEKVEELVERFGPPDVIESQEYLGIAYYLLQKRLREPEFLKGVPVVLNLHSPDFLLRRYNEEMRYDMPVYWYGRMERFCLFAADALICPSTYLAQQVEDMFADEEDLKVLAFPLPWTDVSKVQTVPADPRKVLYTGRLEFRKGVLKLLDACVRMWRRGADFTLSLAGGDTPFSPRGIGMREYIEKRYARWIEQGRVELLGNLPQPELLEKVTAASIAVVPSLWENFPNTCMEAMSLGKVMVVSEHGGQAEMVGDDGKAGYVFSWEREGDFETKLTAALGLDETARQEMGEEAHRRIAELCDPRNVVPRRITHLEEVVRAHQPRKLYPFVNAPQRHGQVEIPACDFEPGLVSGVVPFYNLGAYVEEAVDSILASAHDKLEVVVVNDGSEAPDSLEALDRLRKRDDARIRILDIENAGLANARNVGADAARGEWIVFVDADDAIEPQFVPKALDMMHRFSNVQIVFCWERYVDSYHDIYPGWDFEFPYLLAHNMTAPLAVVRRDAFLAFGRNKSKFAYNFEDYESWVSLTKAGCGGVCLHEPLVRYRIRQDSMWQGSSRAQHVHLYNLLTEEHPELYQQYGPELFCLQNTNGPGQIWLKPSDLPAYDSQLQWHLDHGKRLQGWAQHLEQRATTAERERDELRHQLEAAQREAQAARQASQVKPNPTEESKGLLARLLGK